MGEKMNLDKILEYKLEQHQAEIEQLELRLDNYRGLYDEISIKREEEYLRLVKSLRLKALEIYVENLPILPPILPGTTNDWDFSTTDWVLDTQDYYSAPSSLKINITNGQRDGALCKYSGTENISQGRIITALKHYNVNIHQEMYFRNQSSIGQVLFTNTYAIRLTQSVSYIYVDLWRDDNKLFSKRYDYTSILLSNWHLFRITWWEDTGGAGLVVRVEYYTNNSTWVKIIDFVDTQNQYSSSSINRVGIGAYNSDTSNIHSVLFDDTEIWAP